MNQPGCDARFIGHIANGQHRVGFLLQTAARGFQNLLLALFALLFVNHSRHDRRLLLQKTDSMEGRDFLLCA